MRKRVHIKKEPNLGEEEQIINQPNCNIKHEPTEEPICPVCRCFPVNPIKINCGHIFCFLCIKSVAEISGHCALCRAEISIDFNRCEHLVLGQLQVPSSPSGYYWYYRGGQGWWLYDSETNRELEDAYANGLKRIEKLLAGRIYVISLKEMKQFCKIEPNRTRRICRDTLDIDNIVGVAGLRGRNFEESLDMMRFAESIRL